jgi:hypothetical protein
MIEGFVKAVFNTAFRTGTTKALAEPYVASFCMHTSGSYESRNGLLSQWRAYGRDSERYCIVFDTHKIIQILTKEFDQFHWVYIKLINVIYHKDGEIENIFSDLVKIYAEYLAHQTPTRLADITKEMIVEFLAAATRYKHQGFREEQEARIIAIPTDLEMVNLVRSNSTNRDQKDVKDIYHTNLKNEEKRFMLFFDKPKTKLPIKRIIVGPSRVQNENITKTRQSLGDRFVIQSSATPFVG